MPTGLGSRPTFSCTRPRSSRYISSYTLFLTSGHTQRGLSGRSERPQAPVARLDHIGKDAQRDHSDSAKSEFPSRVIEKRRPAQDRQHGGPRIEPHLKGKAFGRPAAAQNDHTNALADELHQDTHGDDGLDDA